MIGAMRDRIILKRPVDTDTEGAGGDTAWEYVFTEWSKVVILSSNNRIINSQFQLQDGFNFYIRYRPVPQITKGMLIEYNGADYSIISIQQIMDNRRRFWQITANTNGDSPQPIITT